MPYHVEEYSVNYNCLHNMELNDDRVGVGGLTWVIRQNEFHKTRFTHYIVIKLNTNRIISIT